MTSAQDAEAAIARLGEVVPRERTTDWFNIQSRLHTLESLLETANQTLSQRQVAIERLTDQRTEATQALIAFKDRVREEAIQHARDAEHCQPGLNDVMDRLGLEHVTMQYSVEVCVLYEPRIYTAVVEAESEDLAGEHVIATINNGHTDSGEWEDLSIREAEVRDVTLAD